MKKASQRGFSFMEGLIVLGLCLGYIIMVVRTWGPIQTNYYVGKILEETTADPSVANLTPQAVQARLLNRMNINGLYDISQKDIKVKFDQDVMSFTVKKDYEVQLWKFFYVMVRVDESTQIKRR
ncbi:MAG: DUF4845 domain-containing protein [Pseudomonadota bacterium]